MIHLYEVEDTEFADFNIQRHKTIKLTKLNQDFQKQIEKLRKESRIHKAKAEKLMSPLNDTKDKTSGIQKDIESTGNHVSR